MLPQIPADAPDFVKTAQAAALVGDASTSAALFADSEARRYPYHTKEATWLSAWRLSKAAQAEPESLHARLHAAAALHGIGAAVKSLLSKTAVAQTAGGTVYGLTLLDDDGKEQALFPLRNAVEVKLAAQYLLKHRGIIPLSDRQVFASRILKQAELLEAALGDDIEDQMLKQAGMGLGPLKGIQRALSQRAHRLPERSPERASLLKLAAALTTRPTQETLRKLAAAVSAIDAETGLSKQPEIQPIEDVCFALTKVAARTLTRDYVQLATGDIFEKTALQHVDAGHLRDWLGAEFTDQVTDIAGVDLAKFASAAQALPKPTARMLAEALQAAGQQPVQCA